MPQDLLNTSDVWWTFTRRLKPSTSLGRPCASLTCSFPASSSPSGSTMARARPLAKTYSTGVIRVASSGSRSSRLTSSLLAVMSRGPPQFLHVGCSGHASVRVLRGSRSSRLPSLLLAAMSRGPPQS